MTTTSFVSLFSLNTSSGIPIYRQLIDQIKQAIRLQMLKANDRLPSVRSLATALQVNPMTISKAFAQLEVEGVLLRKRGIGMLVAETKSTVNINDEIQESLTVFIQLSRQQGLDDETMYSLLQQALSINLSGRS